MDIAVLKSVVPGYVTMKPNSALAIALAGISLWNLVGTPSTGRRRLANVFAMACAGLGAVTLVEYALGPGNYWLNIDQMLARVVEDVARTPTPGRMALPTAAGLLAMGTALLLLDARGTTARTLGAAGLWASIAIPLGVLIGYVYQVIPVEGIGQGLQMAAHTAIGFLCLGAGIIAARPDRGIARVLRSRGPGGILARQLIPVAFAAPVVFGLVRILAVRGGLLDVIGGDAAVTVATAFLLAWAVWRIAQDLDSVAAARLTAERELADRNAALENANALLTAARHAAEEANRAKSEFLSRMSHELRTPLNSVIGFVGVLQRSTKDRLKESEMQYLDRIGSNGRHLLGLINDILDLARVEARKVEVNIAPVSLEVLVRQTVGELQGKTLSGKVAVYADVPSGLAPLETDATKLKQIIINLVGNALKFTRDGSVTVRVLADSDSRHPLRLDVIDTGIGIAPERLGAIFDAFEQASDDTAVQYGGTGLGLSISRALATLLGYGIEVSSAEGIGSVFSICFVKLVPKPEAAREGAAAQASIGSAVAARTPERIVSTILVIGDHDDRRRALIDQLAVLPVRVIAAGDAEKSVRLALEHRPTVILLDLVMYENSGWETLSRLKMNAELAGTPVIVLGAEGHTTRGANLGRVDFVSKPASAATLGDLVRRYLPRASPRHVLVVDDDEDARVLTTLALREAGITQVTCAVDGMEGLLIAEQVRPDLVVLDLMMPRMDGFAFLEAFRRMAGFADTPVIVSSAKELTEAEREALSPVTSALLQKGSDIVPLLRQSLLSLQVGAGEQARHPMQRPAPPRT